MHKLLSNTVAAAAAVGVIIGGLGVLAAPVAKANGGQGGGLVATLWDCGTAGTLTFYLPPATNPKAPIPGFLASNGTVYLVAAAGPLGGPLTATYGQKTGLAGNGALTCSNAVYDATVLIYPSHS